MKRPVLTITAAVLVIAAGAAAIALATVDPNSFKPEIAAAVKRATGRDLTMNGKIGLKFSLTPTLQVADVALSNPPGFSRPQMATVEGIEVQVALLPLLSRQFQIDRLLIIQPDILLETDANGHPNWQMTPQSQPAAASASQAPAARSRTAISIDAIRIQDGNLTYRDGRTTKVTAIALARLNAATTSPDAPVHLEMDASYNDTAFNLVADTGSLSGLQAPVAWPVKLTLSAAAASISAEGTVARPLQARGYDLAVTGTIPDLSALAPLLNGLVLPPLRDATFAAKVVDKGEKRPEISSLTVHAGPSDLTGSIAGLTLAQFTIEAAAADKPMQASAAGQFNGAPFSLNARFGTPSALMPDAGSTPFPIDIALQAAGANITAKGSVADARAMAGANIALTAQIPDLSALSPLARRPLPALKQVAFQASLTDAAGGFRNGAALRAISLTSPDNDLSGDAAFMLRPRTELTATLRSNRLNLEALTAAAASPLPPPATNPPKAAGPVAASSLPPAKRTDRLFSDRAIPFDQLRATDADLRLDIGVLRAGGTDARAVTTHIRLKDGSLAIDPFTANLPGGRLNATLTADASQKSPPVHLVLSAPGVAIQTILAALNQPIFANGTAEVYADLTGSGETPHAIAGSLNGTLGLAMPSGTIDNRLLGSLFGRVMDSLNALNLVGRGGNSQLRCFAARLEASHGTATVQPLVLSSALLTMTGGGTIDLGNEALGLTFRPQVRMGGTTLAVPVKVTGPIRNPGVAVDKLGAAEANAAKVAGAVIGETGPIGLAAGLFGADKLSGGGSVDLCPAALAAARGQSAPAPAANLGQAA